MNLTIQYPCGENFHTCNPVEISLSPGLYFFETYGASGGDTNYQGRIDKGGKGGYSMGFYYVNQQQKFYVYIGSKGSHSFSKGVLGGWNGGGSTVVASDQVYGASGGGATDIRTVLGHWNDAASLHSRVIVSGGGSGAYGGITCHFDGASGGGETGERVAFSESCGTRPIVCFGTQTGCELGDDSQSRGGFGYGGSYLSNYSPGGGSGYWGGGSGDRTAGGGSGFIGNLSGYKGIHPFMKTGVNDGNGYAIISLILPITCYSNNFGYLSLLLIHQLFIFSCIQS